MGAEAGAKAPGVLMGALTGADALPDVAGE